MPTDVQVANEGAAISGVCGAREETALVVWIVTPCWGDTK